MASLLPLYLRTCYKDEPIFAESKIVTSIYNQGFEGNLPGDICKKVAFDGVETSEIASLEQPNHTNLLKVAADHSDGIILASENLPEEIKSYFEAYDKPVLPYVSPQETEEAYLKFYNDQLSD